MDTTMIYLMVCSTFLQAVAFHGNQASNEHVVIPASTWNPPDEIEPEETEPDDIFADKHESFADCDKFDIEPDEYILFPNGTAYVKDYNQTYTEQFYYLDGDILVVCKPNEDMGTSDPTHTLASISLNLLTHIGIGISMVCLVLYLVVFALVPDLRNLPGCNMASLCLSLFLSYLLMILALTKPVFYNRVACITAAGLMQFFFLASFLWMFIISFDVFRSIRRATNNLRMSTKGFNIKKFLCYHLVAWGISMAFTAAAMIVDNVDGEHGLFKPHFDKFCWFNQKEAMLIFFGGPMFTLICINFILFGISVYNIYANRIKTGENNHQLSWMKRQMMYFRLAIIMGLTWITGALAPALNILWLWYLFAALNAFQGFFIFVAFICTSKVKKHFMKKLCGGRETTK